MYEELSKWEKQDKSLGSWCAVTKFHYLQCNILEKYVIILLYIYIETYKYIYIDI